MKIIDGKAISAKIRQELKQEREAFTARTGVLPGLAVILVGSDPASKIYVGNKIKACEEVGIRSFSYELPNETQEKDVLSLIETLNKDYSVHGILVQLPLPKQICEKTVLDAIDDAKDVDGFSAKNLGLLVQGKPHTISCTPYGVMELLKCEGIDVCGKNAVVVGRSNIVGKPMAALLLNANATVTVCHSKTQNLASITSKADILIAAIGKAKFITADMVKDGAVVVDVGVNRVDGKVCGDVDFENVAPKTSYITPVPGGVGPMTITMLMRNTLNACIDDEK